MLKASVEDHWDNIYASNFRQNLGWYEDIPKFSLELLASCHLEKHEKIVDVGCGESSLIKYLLQKGYENVIGADISHTAINKSKKLLGLDASRVKWIVDDLTNSLQLTELTNIALWHDRAVLHFLLKEADRQAYLDLLNKVLRKDGFVIIATFSLKGAKRCSGLDVINYDQHLLAELLGKNYTLLKHVTYDFTQPSGNLRPFIYTLFQRTG